MNNKVLNLSLPPDDGIFVLRATSGVLYFKPVNISVISFPHPLGVRVVSYGMMYSEDGSVFIPYKRKCNVGSRFCFTISRYTIDISSVLSSIRAHFLEIVSKDKRVSDTDELIEQLMIKNTFSAGGAAHFIHVETYVVENNHTKMDECNITYLLGDKSVTHPATSYASDYPWDAYVQ